MDIKLTFMTNKLFIIIICFLIVSCKPYQRERFKYRGSNSNEKTFWIEIFKDEMFYECIKEGYKNDSIFKLMSKKDLFNSSEFIVNLKNAKNARTLGIKIIKNLPPAFIKSDDEDISEKNFISASCLHYYASRELDSIAKKAYQKHIKMENQIFRD
jgi:hypothetical protein